MKVARDGFGDRFVGECGRMAVLARVLQRLDRLSSSVKPQRWGAIPLPGESNAYEK